MRAELGQPGELAPGYAQVTVTGVPPLDPSSVAFSIEQPPRGYLQEKGDSPWGTTHAWLRPADATALEDGIRLTLGPSQTWNLRPNVTYVFRVRESTRSEPIMLRIAWKGIRMPSQAPGKLPDLPPLVVAKAEGDQPPGDDETVIVTAPKVTATQVVAPDPPKRRLGLWIALALVLIAGGAAAAWYFLAPKPPIIPIACGDGPVSCGKPPPNNPTPPPPVVPPTQPTPAPVAEGPLGAASARAYLQKTPATPETYAEAQRYLKEGSPEALQGALILLTRAADAGSGPARTAIGRMYDPITFTPQTSAMKAPDTDKALLWYQRAAQSNDPEGLYRLGMLLMSGKVSGAGVGPEQGVAALQHAAQLGSKDAQDELDKLRNKPP